jgi:hypothetical protein
MQSQTIGVFMLALTLPALAQSSVRPHEVPRLVSADLPRYPPIAEAAHITGWLKVRITIQNGGVVNEEVLSTETTARGISGVSKDGSPYLTTPTLTNLKSWRFDSDINDSIIVKFTYDIAGTETDRPTNPKVEILPSLDVNITARPVKPTVMY